MPPARRDVAIVMVDVDEHPVTPAALDGAAVSARSSGADLVVVDARTTAGRAWAGDRRVRTVGAGAALGRTSLRRRGMQATGAEVVAFLDAAASPSAGWLDAAVATLDADQSIVAVSAAMAAVGEPTLSLSGNVGAQQRVDDRDRHDVLFPVPEAAVLRREVVDGPDGLLDELSWPCAVADLGWRLRLQGRRTVLDPAVRVDGRCSCRPDGYSGLVVVHSCLGGTAYEVLVPAALVVAAARDPGDIDRFVARSAELAARRQAVQATRCVDDAQVLDLLLAPLEPARGEELVPAVAAAHRDVVDRLGLRGTIPTRQRVLVVTPDVFTTRLAGPAIRAWQIAAALAPRHDVHLASTASVCELSSARFAVSAPGDDGLRDLAARADVVVLQGFAMEGRPYLAAEDKVVVVDLYDPLHLEQLELFKDASDHFRRVTVRGATRVLNEQLVRGDFFVCASAKQRDFWLGQLAAVGRVNHVVYDEDPRLATLLDIAPFGLPDEPPRATGPALKGVVPGIAPGDDVVLWGGGIYNWFDPLTLIRAIDRLRATRPTVRLFFMGLRHPNPDVSEMRVATDARRLSRELGLTDRFVFFNEGWVPYDERQNYLLDADVAVSTHFDHVETEFSFRTRILDYIWGGVPIVATEGDWFATLIEAEQVGITVPAEDVDALAAALERLLADRELAAACRRRLEALRPRFAWSSVLEPIVAFCRSPRRAADLRDAEMRASLWAPDEQRHARWAASLPPPPNPLRRLLASF